MNCFEAGQLIEEYRLSGNEPEALDFRTHTANCDHCKTEMEEAKAYNDFMTEEYRKMRPSADFITNVMERLKSEPHYLPAAKESVAPERWHSGAEGVPGWRGAVLRLCMYWDTALPPEKRFRHFMKVAACVSFFFFLISYGVVLASGSGPDTRVNTPERAAVNIEAPIYAQLNVPAWMRSLLAGKEAENFSIETRHNPNYPKEWWATIIPRNPEKQGKRAYYVDYNGRVRYTDNGTVPNGRSPLLPRGAEPTRR
ncbi:MAG: hypothetical protein ACYS8W_03500 [Planctomycetota bacterium]|jgi:hypothetical protein